MNWERLVGAEWIARLRRLQVFLRNRDRMRISIVGVLASVGTLCWWMLDAEFQSAKASHGHNQLRNGLITAVAVLERSIRECEELQPKPGMDTTWWLDQLAAGVKKAQLSVAKISPTPTAVNLGSEPIMGFVILLNGSYISIIRYVSWLECFRPRVRIESITVGKQPGQPCGVRIEISAAMSSVPVH